MTHPLDAPEIVHGLFYPRKAAMGGSSIAQAQDGTIPVTDDIVLGYRLFTPPQAAEAVIVYFHGNGEVASDYDYVAPLFFQVSAALLVVDYRGYGWSSGQPLTSTLLSDADAVPPALPDILSADLRQKPLIIMGRSLGSAPAIHLAYHHAAQFKGLIVDSGFADMPSVFRRLGIPVNLDAVTDVPVGNVARMKAITMPLLVIHGENDQLLPVENGQLLFDASPSTQKTLLRIPGAGHNNIMAIGAAQYVAAMSAFIRLLGA
jgi:alpha-beta hydrolase superfamily lysophospholipase